MGLKKLAQKLSAVVVFAVLATTLSRADVSDVRSLFESILSEPDGGRPRSQADVSVQLDSLRSAPADQVKSLLPLGQRCLESTSLAVRRYGIALFMVVGMRADSLGLLDPYIDKIAPFLEDPVVGMRNGAIAVLASGSPRPASRNFTYLAAHLYNRNNSDDQAASIAAALLRGLPTDAGVVHHVLQLAEQRPSLQGALIQMLGVYNVTVDEALGFIGGGLSSQNADTRRVAVDAVERLPRTTRTVFTADLQRLIADPSEVTEVRSRALQALSK